MNRRRPRLVSTSADTVLVRLLRNQLDAAASARKRLEAEADDEALHDFRVALRRSRSILRAYRPWLHQIPAKLERRLRKLARATNAARDGEVMLAWLKRPRRANAGKNGAGSKWLQECLEAERARAYADAVRRIQRDFATLDQRLRAALERTRPMRAAPATRISFGSVMSRLIAEHVTELAESLAGIYSVTQREAIHAARIRGKRLRYLLEPLVTEKPAAAAAVDELKVFQDRLGVLCDAFACASRLEAAAEAAVTQRVRAEFAELLNLDPPAARLARPALKGLRELALQLRSETERHYGTVERNYLYGRVQRMLDPISTLGATLGTSRRRVRRQPRSAVRRKNSA